MDQDISELIKILYIDNNLSIPINFLDTLELSIDYEEKKNCIKKLQSILTNVYIFCETLFDDNFEIQKIIDLYRNDITMEYYLDTISYEIFILDYIEEDNGNEIIYKLRKKLKNVREFCCILFHINV